MVFVRMAFFPEGTAAHYAALQAVVEAGAPPPERHYFATGPVDGGWQVVQAWRSREDLDAFNAAVLEPAYAELGGPPFPLPPAVTDFEAVQVAPPPPH